MATVTISLPNQIAKKIDQETRTKGFATRSEFIRNLLREYFFKESDKLVFHQFKTRPLSEIKAEFERTGKYSKRFIDSLIKGLSESSVYANKTSK